MVVIGRNQRKKSGFVHKDRATDFDIQGTRSPCHSFLKEHLTLHTFTVICSHLFMMSLYRIIRHTSGDGNCHIGLGCNWLGEYASDRCIAYPPWNLFGIDLGEVLLTYSSLKTFFEGNFITSTLNVNT